MVLVSFSDPKFIPLILSGQKLQTCRPYKERQLRILKDNPTLHLWYKSRTAEKQKIGEAQRCYLELIRFQQDGVVLLRHQTENKNSLVWACDLDHFAKMDGFENYAEMYAWFSRRYTDLESTEFMCIRWDPLSLVPAALTSPAKMTTQDGEE